jgi:hypothetical protein
MRRPHGAGIDYEPNAASNLAVSDTYLADSIGAGIYVGPTGSGTVTAVLSRVEADSNGYGVAVDGSGKSAGTSVNATVADSVAAGNTNYGFYLSSISGGASTQMMVIRSVAANNGIGLYAVDTTLWIGQSAVTGNASGWEVSGTGIIQSYGTNQINGNMANQSQNPAVSGGSN